MKTRHLIGLTFAVICLTFISLQIDNSLSAMEQIRLILNPNNSESFAEINFLYALLPRACITILVGGVFGMTGSLMQQLTQNTLTSPLTLGTSSGAWLALIIVNIWFPTWIADYSALAAMLGAFLAFGFIVFITGVNNMTGLPLVVSGMVVNILLGAITTGLVLLNEQFAQNIFMWGAGDLAQNGWDWFIWLLPRLSVAFFALVFGPRLLALMRLGHDGAAARGMAVIPTFLLLMTLGIWLVSASITAVGVIGFIGLLTPNIARALGARTPKMELFSSLLLGAALLLATDMLSMLASLWLDEVVPSGIAAATIGAPALLWFSRRKMRAQDAMNVSLIQNRLTLAPTTVVLLLSTLFLGLALSTFVQIDGNVWSWGLPASYQWVLRWPRLVTALFAGIGLAVAGTILQRLINNPLASPDILGVSSGATFALVLASLFFGQSMLSTHWLTALSGSGVILLALILLGRRHHYAPSSLILTGIALTALLEALVQFCLAKGTADSYQILLWLGGSTYRVTQNQSVLLAISTSALFVVGLSLSRWLTLISVGRSFANARGLGTQQASLILLVLVAMLCAFVTATMGPVSFVGLIAPHMAVMLGAHRARAQIVVSSLVGATLMLWADWIGQVALYPNQIAAGIVVSIIGGSYFLCLMVYNRLSPAKLRH